MNAVRFGHNQRIADEVGHLRADEDLAEELLLRRLGIGNRFAQIRAQILQVSVEQRRQFLDIPVLVDLGHDQLFQSPNERDLLQFARR